jgi:putative transport protein
MGMDAVMAWGHGNAVAWAVLVLSLVAVVGLTIGSIKLPGGVKLGIGGALFAGIGFAHFGVTIEESILDFCREFGLILFVYAIGLQVGPGFFNALRRQGLALNLLAAGLVVLGVLTTAFVHLGLSVPLPAALGIMSGATTNTPSLAAGGQILKEVGAAAELRTLPSLGYALAYPFGIMGIILTMILLRVTLRIDTAKEAEAFEEQRRAAVSKLETVNLEVCNEAVDGIRLCDIPNFAHLGVVISRILHDGTQEVVDREHRLYVGDVVLAVGPHKNLEDLRIILGGHVAKVDLKAMPSDLRWERLVVTSRNARGKSLAELDLAHSHHVVVSRINRAGIELTPTGALHLQFGDIVTAIGAPERLSEVGVLLGNKQEALQHAQIPPIFIGIALGVLLGSIPLAIPGLPAAIKLGLAGGPLVTAILLARLGSLGPLVWFMPPVANTVLREIGIVLFLACAGLKSGSRFVDTLTHGDGLTWLLCGMLITALPLLIIGFIGRLALRMNYLTLCGLLAGSMTDPPALAFATGLFKSEAQSLGYATVYPLVMVLRVLAPQLLVLALW